MESSLGGDAVDVNGENGEKRVKERRRNKAYRGT